MKNANTQDFLNDILAQDALIRYKDKYFFVNSCACEFGKGWKVLSATLEVYSSNAKVTRCFDTVFEATCPTPQQCVEEFTKRFTIDGKSFWELEPELEWI